MTEITTTTTTTPTATTIAIAALKAAVDDLSYAAVVAAQEVGVSSAVIDGGYGVWAWGPAYCRPSAHDAAVRHLLSLADEVGEANVAAVLAASRAERESTWTGPLAPPKTAPIGR